MGAHVCVTCNSYNTGIQDLPNMYAQQLEVHIRQSPNAPVTTDQANSLKTAYTW